MVFVELATVKDWQNECVGSKYTNVQPNRASDRLQASAGLELSPTGWSGCEVLETSCVSQTQFVGDSIQPRGVLPWWRVSQSKSTGGWGSPYLGETRPETGGNGYCALVSPVPFHQSIGDSMHHIHMELFEMRLVRDIICQINQSHSTMLKLFFILNYQMSNNGSFSYSLYKLHNL